MTLTTPNCAFRQRRASPAARYLPTFLASLAALAAFLAWSSSFAFFFASRSAWAAAIRAAVSPVRAAAPAAPPPPPRFAFSFSSFSGTRPPAVSRQPSSGTRHTAAGPRRPARAPAPAWGGRGASGQAAGAGRTGAGWGAATHSPGPFGTWTRSSPSPFRVCGERFTPNPPPTPPRCSPGWRPAPPVWFGARSLPRRSTAAAAVAGGRAAGAGVRSVGRSVGPHRP